MNPSGKGGFQEHPELINRSGRKPEPFDLTALIDECFTEADWRKAFKAMKPRFHRGDLRVVGFIAERRFGKPNQPISGKDGGPIVLRWNDGSDTPPTT